MDRPTSIEILLIVLTMSFAVVGWNLQSELRKARAELREIRDSQTICTPVEVVCECEPKLKEPVCAAGC